MHQSYPTFNLKDPMFGLGDSLSIYTKPQKPLFTSSFHQERMQFAPVHSPRTFCKDVKKSNPSYKKLMDFKKGTTTVGFKYAGGIIIAVDSRASMG